MSNAAFTLNNGGVVIRIVHFNNDKATKNEWLEEAFRGCFSLDASDNSTEVSAAAGLKAYGRHKPTAWMHTTSFETRPSAQSPALTPSRTRVVVECSVK